jgi:hypothetical protein
LHKIRPAINPATAGDLMLATLAVAFPELADREQRAA